ncbi:alpha-galactosidase [Halteromyces radiatus]|uniref:alpha-galactosidase n=1 Tax=Halteromyces radiatus TaxID=101107 RepID=UPI00221EF955|nr:alpha-galactosidase [Halteromyces radiatus]KAI8078633.1 alpha-galactosidase [Halteromyces radiatus]
MLPLGITCHPDKHRFYLVSENSTYVIGVTLDKKLVLNLYWGPRLYSMDDIPAAQLQPERSSQDPALTTAPEEYPYFGGLRFGETSLKVTFPSGTRELDLAFVDHYIHNSHHLVITLQDQYYEDVVVCLHYKICVKTGLIERSATISNRSSSSFSLHIDKMLSAAWHLPPTINNKSRQLTTLNGAWSAETQVNTTVNLHTNNQYTLGSTRGIPSAQAYPYFALTSESNLPNRQDTYFGAIAWSGNWTIRMDVDYQGQVRISGGLQPLDFGLTLEAGETFTTPVFMAGYSSLGIFGARQLLPRYLQQGKINPILYNSWEAAGFDVNIQQQLDLANEAAKLGVELFVLDDGWFRGRTSDKAGLGDWFYDENKFPNGLKPLADHVHSLGMKFGLWFEPEMVNPDSSLYREHPDWVYHYRERPRSEARHQLVLDLTNEQVRSYIYDRLRHNIMEIGVDYIKWDMNRPISEAGSQLLNNNNTPFGQDERDAREVWISHVNMFYHLLKQLKTDFPGLLIESCSSGGGRADPGVLKMVDQCWVSDNTQPDARLIIQHGISSVLPPSMMSCWVTDMPQEDPGYKSIPLSYRFHVAFMGALGIGSNILKYTDEQKTEATNWIKLYIKLRHILQLGDLDWLHADHTRFLVTMTTIPNEAVLLAFRPSSPFWFPIPPIRLRKLDPKAKYELELWTTHNDSQVETYSGANLMYKGLDLPYLTSGAYKSVVVWIKKISDS